MENMQTFLHIFVLLLSLSGFFLLTKQESKQNEITKLSEIIERDFKKEFTNFAKTGEVTEKLATIYDHLKVPEELRYQELGDLPEEMGFVVCLTCRATVGTFINYRREDNMTIEQISKLAVELCANLNVQPRHVCENLVELNAPILIHILDSKPQLTSYDICAIIAQTESCGAPKDAMFKLDIQITGDAPPITGHKKASANSGKFYKIVHIPDIHYDHRYTVGGNAKCKDPTCCRDNQGNPSDPENAAGRWGDYRSCDVPFDMVVNAIQTIKNTHPDVDHIYFSGDIIDHGIWETSALNNTLLLEKILQLMKSELSYVPIYPSLGNHETHPVNIYAPSEIQHPEFSTQWLYDYSALSWSTWLPYDALKTVRQGGYYSVQIDEGFRLIVLNNNDCYIYNFWLLYGSNSLYQQLNWLHDTLLHAETNNEKVHILRHIPLGHAGCFRFWTREYTKIVERFHHIIAAQFEGHTHRNEFNLYYDQSDAKYATSIAFNGGSITPYSNVNPNYMVYYVDKTSLEVIDFESYMFNLTDANEHPYREPVWYKSYSFKDFWMLKDLSPASIHALVEIWAGDSKQLHQYWQQKVKQGDPFLEEGCNEKCLTQHLCRIVTTNYEDERRCKELSAKR